MKKTMRKTKLLLLLMVLFISVGYAVLQANLNITGTSNINNPTWDIHWENVSVTNGSVTGANITTPATIDGTKTTVSYSIKLPEPGDFYEFTVDAVNAGTIDGMIDAISSKLNGAEITTLPEYLNYSVTYSDGIEVLENQELKANTSEKYKVRVEFKKDIEASQLPSTTQDLNLQFSVTYKQKNSGSERVRNYYFRPEGWKEIAIGDSVFGEEKYCMINNAVGNQESCYETLSECEQNSYGDGWPCKKVRENLLGRVYENIEDFSNVYMVFTQLMLRHTVHNEKVVQTDVVLWHNENRYYIIGTAAAYEANKETLKNAFGESNCTDGGTYYNCEGTYSTEFSTWDDSVSVSKYGYITAEVDDGGEGHWVCIVGNKSYCFPDE